MSNKIYGVFVIGFLGFLITLVSSLVQIVTTGALFPIVLAAVSHLAMCYIIAAGQAGSTSFSFEHFWKVFIVWTVVVLVAVAVVLVLLVLA